MWERKLSRVRPFLTPWTVSHWVPPSMGFSRQEYRWLPFLSPGDCPDPGIQPGSPTLQADALPSEPPGKPSISKEADGKCLCCSVVGNALGKCQFIVDSFNRFSFFSTSDTSRTPRTFFLAPRRFGAVRPRSRPFALRGCWWWEGEYSEFFCKVWKTSSKWNSPPGPTCLQRGINCSSPDTLSGFHFTSLHFPWPWLPSCPGCLEAGLQLGWTFHAPLDPSKSSMLGKSPRPLSSSPTEQSLPVGLASLNSRGTCQWKHLEVTVSCL